jgi:hypothetical protein
MGAASMSEQAAPVPREDIAPVIEFALARLSEQRAGFAGGTAGELASARPVETWMESLIDRYRAITAYADAPYRAAEMTPEATARQAGYIHALSVAITTMADIWAGHPGKPEYDYKTGAWAVPGVLAEWPVPPAWAFREEFPVVVRRAAEEQDRRELIEAVRRRLGLVAEVHRCRVWKRGEGDWARRCLRLGCPAGQPLGWAPSQEYALGDALAHAGAFLPLPPEEEPGTGLDWDGYVPLLDALPWRVTGGG